MKNTYEINDLVNVDFNYDYLDNVIKKVLKHEHVKNAYFSIIFVDLREIQRLNKEYRAIDRVTDVISFALLDDDSDVDIIGMPVTLADIIINTNRADEQAKEYNHSYKRELMFLSLHGFLHLLGFDHMNEEDEKEMFGLQKEILDAFGLSRD